MSKPGSMVYRDEGDAKYQGLLAKDRNIIEEFQKGNKSPVGAENREGFDRDSSYMKFVSDKKPRTHKPLDKYTNPHG